MHVGEIRVEIMQGRLLIRHELRRYPHLQIRPRQILRQHILILVDFLEYRLFVPRSSLRKVAQVRSYSPLDHSCSFTSGLPTCTGLVHPELSKQICQVLLSILVLLVVF